MKQSRNIAKWGAAALAASALIFGSLSAPAQAASDNGPSKIRIIGASAINNGPQRVDTGWGGV